jgi:hypothetical protein
MISLPAMRISTGTVVDTTNGSVATTIPNASGGNKAEVVVINVTTATYVLPVATGGAVTSSTGMIVNPDFPLVLNVKGFLSVAHLYVNSAGRISINPVENH